jgi:hypothetical protein
MISAVVLTVLRFYENASASYIASGRLIGLAPADYISTSDIAAQELWIVEGGEPKASWEPRSFTELIRLRGVRRDRQFCGCHGCHYSCSAHVSQAAYDGRILFKNLAPDSLTR